MQVRLNLTYVSCCLMDVRLNLMEVSVELTHVNDNLTDVRLNWKWVSTLFSLIYQAFL
jgi:hypothetical protein